LVGRGKLKFKRPVTKKGLGQPKTNKRKFGDKALKPR
jgi:hypothetical protein